MNNYIKKNNCRVCGNDDFVKVLDLGEMPLANAFVEKKDLDKDEPRFPLVLYFCKKCGLVQLLDVVDQKYLFNLYDYLTSASKPLVDHFIAMADELTRKFIKDKNDLMVEIGGNDGTLLADVKDKCRVLNVDPAGNVTDLAKAKGVPTINAFFTSKEADKILKEYGQAKVIVANNVVAHIDDIKDVFKGVEILIAEDGVFVFEVHWVGNLVGDGGFDQIYHEHLCYFSLLTLSRLVEQFNLNIFDVDLVPVHGQSLRVFVGKSRLINEKVNQFLNKEKGMGLDKPETFSGFSQKIAQNKEELMKLLKELKNQGKHIVGYGAPAKGNTLLNYFGIDNSILDFITDTTPLKQGTWTPGVRIPVYAPERLYEANPDYILLLAWNYAKEILEKEKGLRDKGVKFIIPIPEVKII